MNLETSAPAGRGELDCPGSEEEGYPVEGSREHEREGVGRGRGEVHLGCAQAESTIALGNLVIIDNSPII